MCMFQKNNFFQIEKKMEKKIALQGGVVPQGDCRGVVPPGGLQGGVVPFIWEKSPNRVINSI